MATSNKIVSDLKSELDKAFTLAKSEIYNKTWLGNPSLKISPDDMTVFLRAFNIFGAISDEKGSAAKKQHPELSADIEIALKEYTLELAILGRKMLKQD